MPRGKELLRLQQLQYHRCVCVCVMCDGKSVSLCICLSHGVSSRMATASLTMTETSVCVAADVVLTHTHAEWEMAVCKSFSVLLYDVACRWCRYYVEARNPVTLHIIFSFWRL